jgi:hypothetical protein
MFVFPHATAEDLSLVDIACVLNNNKSLCLPCEYFYATKYCFPFIPPLFANLKISFLSKTCSGARIRITLLAAGFIIGSKGDSVKALTRHTRANITSRTMPATLSCQRDCREFTIEGTQTAVTTAVSIMVDAVKRYKTLSEGHLKGRVVSRIQTIRGIQFHYQPPPKHVAPQAAILKGARGGGSKSPASRRDVHNPSYAPGNGNQPVKAQPQHDVARYALPTQTADALHDMASHKDPSGVIQPRCHLSDVARGIDYFSAQAQREEHAYTPPRAFHASALPEHDNGLDESAYRTPVKQSLRNAVNNGAFSEAGFPQAPAPKPLKDAALAFPLAERYFAQQHINTNFDHYKALLNEDDVGLTAQGKERTSFPNQLQHGGGVPGMQHHLELCDLDMCGDQGRQQNFQRPILWDQLGLDSLPLQHDGKGNVLVPLELLINDRVTNFNAPDLVALKKDSQPHGRGGFEENQHGQTQSDVLQALHSFQSQIQDQLRFAEQAAGRVFQPNDLPRHFTHGSQTHTPMHLPQETTLLYRMYDALGAISPFALSQNEETSFSADGTLAGTMVPNGSVPLESLSLESSPGSLCDGAESVFDAVDVTPFEQLSGNANTAVQVCGRAELPSFLQATRQY